jgi:hypothetical protein
MRTKPVKSPSRRGPRPGEADVEKALVRAIREAGGDCLKLPPLFCPGIPDRLALLPGGTVAFVEVKAPGRTPSPLQACRHARLRGLGFRVEVIDSIEGINRFTRSL